MSYHMFKKRPPLRAKTSILQMIDEALATTVTGADKILIGINEVGWSAAAAVVFLALLASALA